MLIGEKPRNEMMTEATETNVWFIPGWLRSDVPHDNIMLSVSNAFPEAAVEFKSWDGNNVIWPLSVNAADKEAWRFAFEIATMPRERRENLILVGHSLGGRIVARVLARLSEHGLRVRRAILMGAAIPFDDPDLAKMGRGSFLPVLAVCNPADYTLRYVYATVGGEKKAAFGANGTIDPCENVIECVTPAHLTEQVDVEIALTSVPKIQKMIKKIANHYELIYMAYVKRLLHGEKPSDNIMVPQGFPSVEGHVSDDGAWWEILEEELGWKLEKNKLTGHCRIIDPEKTRMAWGAETEMRKSFRKVKTELERGNE